uniref:Chromatin assembly factor 1 subunit A n=1 Tax=Kwoniella dejecticola CBS 10117 TaxID=1296121 RepID=A0A1A6A9Y2_9TREE|nr:uncharacterized protein I303_02882 [Kwoniella dejecticola CBS 10117]OBR86863.1 hypothetical protein I303_02882 [Kwoniella dejecticola CBS 10117]
MTPNTTLENTQYRMDSSPIRELKRKAGEEVINIEDKENEGVEKKAKIEAASSLVELKGRKLIFKQEPASRKLPRRQLLNFEGWLLDEVEAGNKISSIPEEFHGLIVMAGHELTSSNESLFIKHLKSALELTKGGQDPLPNEVIAPLITRFFTMKHYGFVPSDFSPSTSTVKIPAALQIRCWEANDVEQHFPAGQTEEIVTRRKEREQAREDCLRILTGLDDIEKLELIKGEKVDKTQTKEVKEKASKIEEPEEEAARLKKEEREAKKAEVAEKKAAKEKEQERRAAIVAKQAKTMMGFFKAKPPATPLISRASEAGPSNLKGSVSPVKGGGSDYARAFRPMNQRPHVHVAEINQWRSTPQSTVSGWSERKETDVNSWKARDFLDDHLMKHGNRSRAARTRLPKGLKIMPPSGSVAEVYSTLEDAEDPRAVLSQLQDRRKFPWKTLSFDQQARPPYCGTFTKKSVVVGPRTPFAQDPIFDYSYDSSDDWVDDEGGEDVDDFGEGEAKEDEDDEEGSESEGEFDDWLDDAEDVEFTPVDGDTGSLNGPEQARLPMKVVKKSRDIPKKVVKLIPTWKGPVWESRIGEEGSEGLEGYRIQLLNDTPSSFDPFTYCSPEPAQTFKASFSTTAIGISLNVRCLLSTDLVVSPPPPPPTNVPEKIISVPNSSSISSKPVYDTPTSVANGDSPAQLPSRSRPPPKVAFPEEHLPELYRMIDGSKKIKPDLVSQLRERFENIATKAAIEAKLKEVAIREGKTKDSQWKVKADAWISVGLTPPAAGSNPASAPPTNPSADALSNFFSSPARSTAANPVLNGNAPGKTADEPMVIDA